MLNESLSKTHPRMYSMAGHCFCRYCNHAREVRSLRKRRTFKETIEEHEREYKRQIEWQRKVINEERKENVNVQRIHLESKDK